MLDLGLQTVRSYRKTRYEEDRVNNTPPHAARPLRLPLRPGLKDQPA